eukprot:285446_1
MLSKSWNNTGLIVLHKTGYFLTMAHTLYVKYVNVDSPLEVNISGYLRNQYRDQMQDYQQFVYSNEEIELTEIFELFDMIIEEMYYLMLNVVDRYKAQKLYDEDNWTVRLTSDSMYEL